MTDLIELATMVPVLFLHIHYCWTTARRQKLAQAGVFQSTVSIMYHGISFFYKRTILQELMLLLDQLSIMYITWVGHALLIEEDIANTVAIIPFITLCVEKSSIGLYLYISIVNAEFSKRSNSAFRLFVVDLVGALSYFYGIAGVMHIMLCFAFSIWYDVLK